MDDLTDMVRDGAWGVLAMKCVYLAAEHPRACSDLGGLAMEAVLAAASHERLGSHALDKDLARALAALAADEARMARLAQAHPGWAP